MYLTSVTDPPVGIQAIVAAIGAPVYGFGELFTEQVGLTLVAAQIVPFQEEFPSQATETEV